MGLNIGPKIHWTMLLVSVWHEKPQEDVFDYFFALKRLIVTFVSRFLHFYLILGKDFLLTGLSCQNLLWLGEKLIPNLTVGKSSVPRI